MSDPEIIRARKRGMNLLMTRDRTEANVRKKLTDDGYSPEVVDDAVEYLRSYHYIDDMRYACEYIRFKSGSMSRKQIDMKLREKGVDKGIIESAFVRYDEENGTGQRESELEVVGKLMTKRCPQGLADLDYKAKQKLFAYLYGKGFSVDVIEEEYRILSQKST